MSASKEHYHDEIEAGQRGTKQHPIGLLNMPGFKPETWNPIVGCDKVSPGCDHCFAEIMANRLSFALGTKGEEPSDTWIAYSDVITNGHWNGKTRLVKSALDKPAKWKKPRMIFTVDMGDLFHETVPFEWIDQIFDIILDNLEHIFIILTKRPERLKEYTDYRIKSGKYYGHSWVWYGVTVENQEQANKRIPILLQIPAAKRFVSIEPMLGPIDLECWDETGCPSDFVNNLDWVICGGETGPKARPMHPDWVRSLRDQCKAADVPFFFKQWGEWMDFQEATSLDNTAIPGQRIVSAKMDCFMPDKTEVIRVGRKYTGNLLDGQQYHEWPKTVS